jgi:hypothetical protein
MAEFTGMIDDANAKLQQVAVVLTELAKVLLPTKQSGKFSTGDDLNGSILNRERHIQQSKVVL